MAQPEGACQHPGSAGGEESRPNLEEEGEVGMVLVLESGGLAREERLPQPASWLDVLKKALLFPCFQLCPLASSHVPAVVLSWCIDELILLTWHKMVLFFSWTLSPLA